MPDDEEVKELPDAGILGDALMEAGEPPSELDKIFKQMMDPDNIYHNTELTADEITAFSTLGAMASKYKIDLLKKWLVDNMSMRVSKGRKGRAEWVKIASRHMQADDKKRGLLDSLRRD